jgi:hypothetical protein
MEWVENGNGNFVVRDGSSVLATVYRAGDEWGANWNGALDGKARRLKAKYLTSEEACEAAEKAIDEGQASKKWWPLDGEWRRNRNGNASTTIDQVSVVVKQARTGSFYVASALGGMLGRGGRTGWFYTEQDAMNAVRELLLHSGDWTWVWV